MDYHKILKKVYHYAIDTIENSSMAKLACHNRKHTESVASYAGQMANHYQLGDRVKSLWYILKTGIRMNIWRTFENYRMRMFYWMIWNSWNWNRYSVWMV